MIALVVFASIVSAVLAAGQEVAVSQDTLGNYNLKYQTEGISRVEHGDQFGNVNGGFSYIDPHGIVRRTEFTSGVHGYNAVGTDIPVPVHDTPEVAHAKAQHLAALHAAYLVPRFPEFQGPEDGFVPFGHAAPFGFARFQPALHFAPAPAHFGFHHAPAHFGFHHAPAFAHFGIAETPEVLSARAQHFAAHAAARHHL